ncbi:hypothetical protein Tco_1207077 [Tanacetum coccineum]
MTTIVYGANVVASSSSGRISNADVIGTENDSLDRNSATRTDNSLAQSEYHGNIMNNIIVSHLEKAKLTPKFRGSEIIQLENIITATLEDWLNGSSNVNQLGHSADYRGGESYL